MKKLLTTVLVLLMLTVLACTVSAAPATLQDILNDAQAGSTVTLQETYTESVTVTKDLILDLNGFSINGTLTAGDGVTVQVKDSKTDDFTVSDGDYGQIADTAGNVIAAPDYLAVTETATSYHKLVLKASSATLRAEASGIYYTCQFAGDEVIKRNIDSFGVALNVNAAPTAAQIAEDTEGKKRADNASEHWLTGAVNEANGVLLKGIMKEENGYVANKRNADTQVYGVAYLRQGDTYHLGSYVNLTLKAAVEYADTKWITLEEAQKEALLSLHKDFETILKGWNVTNLDKAAEEAYQNRSFKVLTLGHSLAVDAGNMLAYVAANEGYADITIATLYYSGCSLQRHVNYLTSGTKPYKFYLSSTADPNVQPTITAEYTMDMALTYTDWDVIIMQNGVFDSATSKSYQPYLQIIIDHVTQVMTAPANPNANPDFIFGWNMIWTAPEDETLLATSKGLSDTFPDRFQELFDSSALKMYQGLVGAVQDHIIPTPIFKFIIPSGTAMMNANSSYLTDQDLYRDYIHANDYGRLMASYVWYYTITGKEFEGISVDRIPAALRYFSADRKEGDLVLTAEQKAILEEAVKNALENPFTVTQSQYTTAP